MTITHVTFQGEPQGRSTTRCPDCSETMALIQEDLETFRCKACGTRFRVEDVLK